MEQIPHHREGIQEQLDKAYAEGHDDNKAFDQASAIIREIKGEGIVDEARGTLDDKEMREELSQEEVLMLVKESNYLDTSFEGKETHTLNLEALTKEEAFEGYRNSGGKTWIWDELEKNMPYTTPEAKTLDVMILNFNKDIRSDDALLEMDKLGVRPLTYEELIQYGIAHPSHQEQKILVGLGSKHTLDGDSLAPVLGLGDAGRLLGAGHWCNVWHDEYRLLVARK